MMLCRPFALSWMMSLVFWTSSAIYAQEPSALDEGIGRLAAAVAEVFDREGYQRELLVNSIVGELGDGSAFLRDKLIQALERNQFEMRPSPLALSGSCTKHFGPSPVIRGSSRSLDGPEVVALNLKAEIRERQTDTIIQAISIPIFDAQSVILLSPTSDLPAGQSERERQRMLNDDIDRPRVTLVGTNIQPRRESQYAIQILTRSAPTKALHESVPVDRHGLAFVNLSRGDEYVVRLHNHTEHEAAVTLNIDGLNIFAFSQQGNANQVLIAPHSSSDIPGWVITDERSDAFEVSSYAKSAAAEKRIPMSSIGAITAAFHAAWDPSQPPPDDEANAKSADTATSRGRKLDQKYISVKRVVGKQRSFITVRYDR